MGQMTIYIDAELEKKMKACIKKEGVSQSRWIARLIELQFADAWPQSVKEAVGAWKNMPEAETLRTDWESDSQRENL